MLIAALVSLVFIVVISLYQAPKREIKPDNFFFSESEATSVKKSFDSEDYEKVIITADNILETKPECFQALVSRAIALEQLNYNLDAIDDFLKATTIFDRDPEVFGLLGLTYKKIGDWNNAEKYLKMSVENDPSKYGTSLDILLNTSDLAKQKMIESAQSPSNMVRRS